MLAPGFRMAKSGDRSENRISAGDCDAVAAAVRLSFQNLFVAAVPVDMWAKAEPIGASRSSTYPRASRRVMLALLVKPRHTFLLYLELHVPRTPQAELLLSMLARANTVNNGVCISIFCVGARQRCALHLHTRCWHATSSIASASSVFARVPNFRQRCDAWSNADSVE